jgi:hypothetical protein
MFAGVMVSRYVKKPMTSTSGETAPLDTTSEKNNPIGEPFPGPEKQTVMVNTKLVRFGPKNPSS